MKVGQAGCIQCMEKSKLSNIKLWKAKRIKIVFNTGKIGKMAKKYPCQEKHRDFGYFIKTLRKHKAFGYFSKTQGIYFVKVVNSMILKVNDIALFVVNIFKLS